MSAHHGATANRNKTPLMLVKEKSLAREATSSRFTRSGLSNREKEEDSAARTENGNTHGILKRKVRVVENSAKQTNILEKESETVNNNNKLMLAETT